MIQRIRVLLPLAALAGMLFAQGPKILIVTDMEGVAGINDPDEQLTPGQRRFEEARRLLHGEVNAAVDGAFQGGASEVIVWDGHDGSRTLSVDLINNRAKLLQGRRTPTTYYFSERLYDGVMFVGQHSMAGTKNGILCHTQSFTVESITINGKPVGELGQVAAIAGHYHIPVIMLSGDEAACAEMRALQPKAETAAVKQLVGTVSMLSVSHERARQLIQGAAARAVQRTKEFTPWIIEGPVEMKITMYPESPGVPTAVLNKSESKQYAPRVVSYRGRNVQEVYEAWLGR